MKATDKQIKTLYKKWGWSQSDIARKFGMSSAAVHYRLKRFGILNKRKYFLEILKELGYNGVEEFFSNPDVARKTFKQTAIELKCSHNTVLSWYKKFLSFKEEKHGQ